MDIKTFLLARIEEDEAAVAKPVADLPVTRVHHPHTIEDVPGHPGSTIETPAHDRLEARPVAATYSADPARVLAECAAKRAIIEQHAPYGGRGKSCATCADWPNMLYDRPDNVAWPCPTLRALAAVHADHPDYQPEWAV